MAIHKLIFDDFEEDTNYALIAIHCSLEDYRLSYLLNKYLNIKLQRKSSDLDYASATYTIYEWEDIHQLIIWNLVSNICKVEETAVNSGLFLNNTDKVLTTYNLVPEYKNVNYILKIDYQTDFNKQKRIIDAILAIPQIVTAYSILPEALKSKTNLIFN